MASLSADNLACVKRDRVLFEGLSLRLQPGQILQIAGVNGAGKTSLLRILAGLSMPESGRVCWNDSPIDDDPCGFHQSLIYIGHKPGVNRLCSAQQNLEQWCRIHEVAHEQHILPVIDRLGLVGLEDLPAGQLSAGQQRRIALARLWLKSAPLWVLDEPFTALDRNAIALVERRMQQHLEHGGMIAVTSHQPLSLSHSLERLELEYQL
ncbi:Cytochrome c bioproteinis ATP-binding export protein CcmA [Saliniradius amylolyticus]|uniref:Cytochrome c bioproteinis ATP-binding export protein CcmA n=1 Tax=Saliniradius amylolyticus TaxID=2183582 RepID=A0A2S2E0X7_9ALTE|nr:cytochrome c biogenesis heme-transporting ATPase CcmA [Saliniradius amylolyticus]AWL11305.1 Cytochrome c bioproteinis ATP-binding export protein CcmA [Saliniradius amylolyticus]